MKRYKELKFDGKVFTEQYKIDEILINNNFNWFLDCEVENVRIEIQYETLIFNSGVFFNGTWYYGVFRDGEWKSGTWENGVWYNGIWRNGLFESGLIFNGKFFNGKIESGTIRGGDFYNIKIDSSVVREDIYKQEKDEDVQPVEPEVIIEKINIINYHKFINELNEVDPFGEENWDEHELYDLELYLSEEQEPTYRDGTPLDIPWTKKYYVLFNKNGNYYILGDYRFTDTDFKMFYADTRSIERGDLVEYYGDIYRELNKKEKIQVIEILSNSIKFTRDLLDNDNGRHYTDIINGLIN